MPLPRRLATIAGVAVVMLLVLEVAVRLIDQRLPEPLLWHSEEAQAKVEQMDALARRGGVDLVFLGTSIVNAGVEPAVVGEHTGGRVGSYNAGLSSGTPRLMEPWLLDVVGPRLSPDVVVIGLTSFEVAAVERSPFFDAFAASPAGRQSMRTESRVDRADRWLGERSALWANRVALRSPDSVLDAVRGAAPPVSPEVAALQPNGRTSFLQTQQFEDRVLGVGIDLTDWTIGGDEPAALRRLVDGVTASGARAVLVEMPVTDEYIARHPRGAADYAEFEAFMARFATEAGVDLISDLDTRRDHRWFADEIHMNNDGATAFTAALVDELRRVGAISA